MTWLLYGGIAWFVCACFMSAAFDDEAVGAIAATVLLVLIFAAAAVGLAIHMAVA